MADRTQPIRKTPAEILHDILDGHLETCRMAVARASEYLPVAQQELAQPFRAYAAGMRGK